jgi:hypothetical protein
VFLWAFKKARGFQDDREVRLLTSDWPRAGGEIELRASVLVPVDLSELVQDVRVGPGADARFLERVALLTLDHGLSAPVRHSELDDPSTIEDGVPQSQGPG